MGKTGRRNKKYSAEFKISVILDMRKNGLSYRETVRKYGIGDPEVGGTRLTIQRWERIYLEEGAQGLMEERRGKLTQGGKKRGRPSKPKYPEAEDLAAKCRRLEMENEYLKKLIALVQSEEENESGTKRK